MKKDLDGLEIAILVALGIIIVPVVVNSIIVLGSVTVAGVTNGINKIKFNKKIKKGLKDGSIVEVDGKYYEVEVTVEEA